MLPESGSADENSENRRATFWTKFCPKSGHCFCLDLWKYVKIYYVDVFLGLDDRAAFWPKFWTKCGPTVFRVFVCGGQIRGALWPQFLDHFWTQFCGPRTPTQASFGSRILTPFWLGSWTPFACKPTHISETKMAWTLKHSGVFFGKKNDLV